MTDPIQPTAAPATPAKGGTLRRVLIGAAFAATFVAGGLACSIVPAAAQMAGDMGAMQGDGGGHGGWRHHGGGMMAGMMMAHLDKSLDAIGASDDQKTRIHAILKAAHDQMGGMHDKMADTHKQFAQFLLGPTVNRAGLEQLREARMADADRSSKAMVAAMADAADVLTPDQRGKLAAIMAEHHEHHQHHDS